MSEIPVLGPFIETLEVFLGLTNRWFELETCPPLVRLAFGAVLLQPVENQTQGYEILSTYLPFQVDLEETSDFLYQINRRRESATGIADVKINRLAKWSVQKTSQGFVPIIPLGQPQQLAEFLACRLELDINTIAEFEGEFSREQLPRLFDELVALGKEIAEQGDIR
jgi:hypothetical protein